MYVHITSTSTASTTASNVGILAVSDGARVLKISKHKVSQVTQVAKGLGKKRKEKKRKETRRRLKEKEKKKKKKKKKEKA